jgi:prepilin-type N-terminal cleavage/methylation domain-containing protein
LSGHENTLSILQARSDFSVEAIMAAAKRQVASGTPATTGAFTLIELLVVIAIILVLAGLTLSTIGYVQKKGARARAESEIAAMSAALESYKADNGIYPQYNGTTGGHALYQGLSGDGNDSIGGTTASTGTPSSSGKSYMTLKANMLMPNPPDATTRVIDPFRNDYNYIAPGTNNAATFDLWSTANASPATDQLQWIKNW